MLNIPVMITPIAAFAMGLCAVPMIRRIALAHGFVDNPDRRRKFHGVPVALGGGVAVWFSAWSGWSVSAFGFSSGLGGDRYDGWFLAALGLSSFLTLFLGVIDDRWGLRARHKLAGQLVPAMILVLMGVRIDAWRCFGYELELGVFAFPVTIFWIVLVVNAFNLIDGMDGFCGSLGLIAALAISFLAYTAGRFQDMALALSLAGSLAAFLRFNLPPANIYLGDAGSMTIGLMISVLTVRSCQTGTRTAVLLLPMIALLMLPILDVVTAASRRLLKGNSLFTPDRGHIHHCMKMRLGSAMGTLCAAAVLASSGATCAVLEMRSRVGDPVVCFVIASSVGLLACTSTFGATEWRLLLFRLTGAISQLSAGRAVAGDRSRQECHLHGNRDWASVWDELVREGENSGVWRIDLSIELATAGELYQARWRASTTSQDEPHWSIDHTLHAGDLVAGTISVSGAVNGFGSPYLDKVERLVRVVENRLMGDDPRLSSSEASALAGVNLPFGSALT